MKTQITMDTAGRILIPKELRDRLDLEPGDILDIRELGEQITLLPVRQIMPLEKRHGFWVYTGQLPAEEGAVDPVTLIAEDREDRATTLLAANTPTKKQKA